MGNSLTVSKKPKHHQPQQQPQHQQPQSGDEHEVYERHQQQQFASFSRRVTLSQSPGPFFRPVVVASSSFTQRSVRVESGPSHAPKRPSEGVTSDCSTITATESLHGTRRSGQGVGFGGPPDQLQSLKRKTDDEMHVLSRKPLPHDNQEVDGYNADQPNKELNNDDDDQGAGSVVPCQVGQEEEEAEVKEGQEKANQAAEEQQRRIQQAETILLEIAKEFAAKRAAGLVPMKPVPARTLLWEEMERRAQRVRLGVGRRGTCLFGRDSDSGPCGCSTYKMGKKLLEDGRETNTGGVCECCNHGAPWHRLAGGTMAATASSTTTLFNSRLTGRLSMRSRKGTSRSRASSRNSNYAAASRSASGALQQTPMEGSVYSLGSDYYDEFDDEYSDDESDDDDDVANEVARPHGMMVMDDPAPPLVHSHARSEGDTLDRSSLFSNGDSFGLPPRLSSTSRHLDKLLGAIAKYRTMGLSEAEIEVKLRRDFPPTERLSHEGKRSSSSRPTRASQ
uniref:Uncharacterized protein n=1 Tax=Hyaloperonospora arabidopsidis (strain Emoy2) TaxID=559515 RepID=M4B8X6_HYAAE